jgi:hypothetical protein
MPKPLSEKFDESYFVTDFNPSEENTHHGGGTKKSNLYNYIRPPRRRAR